MLHHATGIARAGSTHNTPHSRIASTTVLALLLFAATVSFPPARLSADLTRQIDASLPNRLGASTIAWAPRTQTEVLDRGATLDGSRPPTIADNLRLTPTPLEANMLAAINQRRSLSGLHQVQIDPRLTQVARQRSADMVRRGYFSHTTPEGSTFVDTLIDLGMTGTVGEILGRTNVSDDESARSVLVAFTQSPSHNLHLVYASYDSIGVGSAVSQDNMKYYTVIFRAPR